MANHAIISLAVITTPRLEQAPHAGDLLWDLSQLGTEQGSELRPLDRRELKGGSAR